MVAESNDIMKKIGERKKNWEEHTLKPALEKFKMKEPPARFYTPLDLENFDFLNKVGFPGEYPFTAGTYAVSVEVPPAGSGGRPSGAGLVRASNYSGYGTAEDTRDYYKKMQERGVRQGPNLAFHLPTQCGYDSDNPLVSGDVGKVGVAVDTLRDFEIIYEAYQGEMDLDRIASNYTINSPANIIMAMYFALAEKRGIPLGKLRSTPQNNVLKEYIARGTYIFPPRHSMRMFRDSAVFFTRYCPNINITSIGGEHIRGAGGTWVHELAYNLCFLISYLQEGVNAGLDIDSFAHHVTVNNFGGSMDFWREIALQRAGRRMWAKIIKERFGARNERSWLPRAVSGVHVGSYNCTVQRPLNNLVRGVVSGVASSLSGGGAAGGVPYDEPLGLGWSLEAIQLSLDAERIIQYEARMTRTADPLAGSYYVESLTDETEAMAWEEVERVNAMGGAVAAIENGYMPKAIAQAAYERQKRVENCEDWLVGVNCFTSENEIDVQTKRMVPHPYDPVKREQAEEKQIRNLAEVKRNRDSRAVSQLLRELKEKAKKENENLIPHFIECVKAYASIQEICDVLRDVFGEYKETF